MGFAVLADLVAVGSGAAGDSVGVGAGSAPQAARRSVNVAARSNAKEIRVIQDPREEKGRVVKIIEAVSRIRANTKRRLSRL